jgi:hypothetical protein
LSPSPDLFEPKYDEFRPDDLEYIECVYICLKAWIPEPSNLLETVFPHPISTYTARWIVIHGRLIWPVPSLFSNLPAAFPARTTDQKSFFQITLLDRFTKKPKLKAHSTCSAEGFLRLLLNQRVKGANSAVATTADPASTFDWKLSTEN